MLRIVCRRGKDNCGDVDVLVRLPNDESSGSAGDNSMSCEVFFFRKNRFENYYELILLFNNNRKLCTCFSRA